MRLLIVSNMAHYYANGAIVSPWRAAVGEIDALASLADEVRHLAALHDGPPPPGSVSYREPNVRPLLLEPVGGRGATAKLRAAAAVPGWFRTLGRELDRTDAVQVRSPCNIAAVATLLLALRQEPGVRWVKYAGEWKGRRGEPFSYRLQRALLRSGAVRAAVGMGDPSAESGSVRYVPHPSFSDADAERAERATRDKTIDGPVRLLFAGRLERAKGVGRTIRILSSLIRRGVDASLEIAGSGSELSRLRDELSASGAASRVTFLGWLDAERLEQAYERAHFLLLPSDTEGWAKALSEAAARRAVPLAGDCGGAPAILGGIGAGAALPVDDLEAWADRIAETASQPDRWRREADRCCAAARRFTYERYLETARILLHAPRKAESSTAAAGGWA